MPLVPSKNPQKESATKLISPADRESATSILLSSTLQLAVPLWIDQLRKRDWEYVQERAKICSDYVAEHGDVILFRGKKKGESATAFNHLAEGIACLSFCPGGVKIFGGHWEACLDQDIPGRSKVVLSNLLNAIRKGLEE